MFLAHRRAAAHLPVVLDLLQWRLTHPASLPPAARDEYRGVLDRLVTATQVRHPVVGDLARRVRYRCFDAPLIAAERARGQQEVRAELDRMPADPADPRWRASIDAIVAAAEPILGVFGERHHAAMLEAMTRRYYRVRTLTDLRIVDRDGRPLLTAAYTHEGQDYRVLATTVHTAPAGPATGEPLVVQADLRQVIAGLPGSVRGPARPVRDRRGGARRRPRPLGGQDLRGARHAARAAGPRRRRRAPRRQRRALGVVHVPAGRAAPAGRGPHVARAAPDGRRPARRVAPVGIRAHPAAVARRRAPVPGGRQEDAGGPSG